MEELQIKVSNTLGTISTNFEEIEANLKEILANYKGIIVTEDTVKESKKDIAELRKIRTSIDDKKKEMKKVWNKPYTEFENKCKELMALVDEPINEINSQVSEFETKRKEEKLNHLHELFNEQIGEYDDYLTFEGVFNDKWLNVSTTDKDVKFDISEAITKVRSELDAIKALNSEIENECIKAYKNAGNSLTAAIQKNSDYITAKSLAKAKLEEEKRAEEVKIEEPKAEPIEQPEVPFMNLPEENPSFIFKVTGNDNIQKVKEYLDFAEIPYIEV